MVLNAKFVCFAVFGTLFLSQVETHHGPGPHLGENDSIMKSEANSHQFNEENLLEVLSSLPINSPDSLRRFWVNTKATINKLSSCNPDTQLQLTDLAIQKLGDFQSCVNATYDFANFSQMTIDTFKWFKFIVLVVINLAKSVFSCHSQPNLYDFARCAISSLQASGNATDQILERAKFLLTELQNNTDNLVTDIESCFGFHKNNTDLNPTKLVILLEESEFVNEALNLINNHC